jgi:hypothetical protein
MNPRCIPFCFLHHKIEIKKKITQQTTFPKMMPQQQSQSKPQGSQQQQSQTIVEPKKVYA